MVLLSTKVLCLINPALFSLVFLALMFIVCQIPQRNSNFNVLTFRMFQTSCNWPKRWLPMKTYIAPLNSNPAKYLLKVCWWLTLTCTVPVQAVLPYRYCCWQLNNGVYLALCPLGLPCCPFWLLPVPTRNQVPWMKFIVIVLVAAGNSDRADGSDMNRLKEAKSNWNG